MRCKICGKNNINKVFSSLVLKQYNADYYYCDNCGFLGVYSVSWISKAYANPINISDTGYLTRNIFLGRKTFLLFSWLYGHKAN